MKNRKKVLLVSSYPYSLSSRGMDVLTNCFEEEEWDVDHLTFPRMFITPEVKPPETTTVNSIFAPKTKLPYIDRIMFRIPVFLFNFIKYMNNKKVKDMDFTQYDYIVLESGKPLFLLDLIPETVPLIYRLSDSVQLVLGKHPSYRNLEKTVFERSKRMVFKKEIYVNFLEPHQRKKVTVIENGMVIPEINNDKNKYTADTVNAVYVGLHQLDFPTVKNLVERIPRCHFHIIGPCLGKNQVKKLQKNSNFHFYHFLTKEQYMPMLHHADLAIFPFKRTEAMKWFGLTSKFLHFMYYNLPIISYPTGVEGEFKDLPVLFADTREEFFSRVQETIAEGKKISYNLDFNYFSSESRKKEYKKFIRTL